MEKTNKMKKRISALLVAFGVIALWRGLWGLLELYIFPSNPEASYWCCLLSGIVILLITEQMIDQFT